MQTMIRPMNTWSRHIPDSFHGGFYGVVLTANTGGSLYW
jgi:hypothetical protein